MLLESWQTYEPFQRRCTHLRHVLEPQMICHQQRDLLGVVIGKAQPPANLFGHARSHLYVLIESDPVIWARRRFESWRLAHVVQQHTPGKRWRALGRKLPEHKKRVYPNVSFRMELRRLGDSF